MSSLILSVLVMSFLTADVMDIASIALDSVGMSPQEMNFDRHWAKKVELADSTVVRCIQDVWALPVVADSVSIVASSYNFTTIDGGLDSLLSTLFSANRSYISFIDTLYCADSLALATAGMWARDDSVGSLGEWGLLYSSRNVPVPFDEIDIELDVYTQLLTNWTATGISKVSPELIVGLVMGLELENIPGNLSAPGISGSVIDYSLDSEISWVIGGSNRNIYTDEVRYDLIIDTGGDDLYLAGGTGIGILGYPVGLIADLSGNDSYLSDVPVSQGSGFMGYGALIDLSGDDVYRGSSMSQGSAVMGQALFVDLDGNDYFTADVHSQSAATLGKALFYDRAGDDIRKVSAHGQGFGGPGGIADLVDAGGNDTYLAGFTYPHEPLLPQDNLAMSQGFGMGLRPFCAGGIGTLCDLGSGNDTYRAEVFGQGGAYFYSLGILYDESGQDIYSSAQYSQGSGIHLASGILVDGAGDDQYVSRNGPSQGSAHDLSTGFLLDSEGDDYYATDGGQGLALTNSAAVFIDVSGTDLYALRNLGQGQMRWARGSAGSGLFLDLADSDYYLGEGADSSGWYREYSSGLDLPVITEISDEEIEEIGNPESLDIDSLFTVASEWGVGGNRERVLAHRDELALRGIVAVDFVFDKHLDSWDGLEHRAIKKVLQDNSDYAEEQMLLLLESEITTRELSNLISWVGEISGEEARPLFEEMLTDSNETGIQIALIRTLGEIGNIESLPVISPFANSESERVRRQVAVSLGEFGENALEFLTDLSDDSSLAVRSAAIKNLNGIEEQ